MGNISRKREEFILTIEFSDPLDSCQNFTVIFFDLAKKYTLVPLKVQIPTNFAYLTVMANVPMRKVIAAINSSRRTESRPFHSILRKDIDEEATRAETQSFPISSDAVSEATNPSVA